MCKKVGLVRGGKEAKNQVNRCTPQHDILWSLRNQVYHLEMSEESPRETEGGEKTDDMKLQSTEKQRKIKTAMNTFADTIKTPVMKALTPPQADAVIKSASW